MTRVKAPSYPSYTFPALPQQANHVLRKIIKDTNYTSHYRQSALNEHSNREPLRCEYCGNGFTKCPCKLPDDILIKRDVLMGG